MASITISNLNAAGISLLQDQESYLDEVKDSEMAAIVKGGALPATPIITAYTAAGISGAVASIEITGAFKPQR